MRTRLIPIAFVVLLAACKGRAPQTVEATSPPNAAQQPNIPAPETAATPQRAGQPAQAPGQTAQQAAPVPKQSASGAQTEQVAPNLPRPETVTIPEGSVFRVRLDETLDTRRNRAGESFQATLIRPIDVDGVAVIPGGTRCTGLLVESKPSGRFKGNAVLSLRLRSFELNGRTYDVRTSRAVRMSGGHKKGNWISIGGGAGAGAAFGAVAGPGGALIGAGAGAAAGSTVRAFTGKKNVRLPVETRLSFVLRAPASVAE